MTRQGVVIAVDDAVMIFGADAHTLVCGAVVADIVGDNRALLGRCCREHGRIDPRLERRSIALYCNDVVASVS